MKVYSILLQPNDMFVFYKRDKILTCVNDTRYLIPNMAQLWTKKDGWVPRVGPRFIDKVAVPSYRVYQEEKDYFIKENIIAAIKSSSIVYNKERVDEMSCFIPYRNLNDGTVELGICTYQAIGEILDQELTHYVERQFNMKAFW